MTPTISLCMICGNESANIIPCLELAKEAFDELVLVRAIGNLPADETLALAAKWCAHNRKGFIGDVYCNRVELPHVDDFAAARNEAFEKANCDWLLWLDADDRLDQINCARIREAVATIDADTNALFCDYKIAHKGTTISRERLIRQGKGRWVNAVHEVCVVEGKTLLCPQITVYHNDPGEKRKRSAARNLAILERVVENIERNLFYLHAELNQLGRKDDARIAGMKALALLPDSMTEERYFILCNIGLDGPVEFLHEASRIEPNRREAWADLCQRALTDDRIGDAIAYFRIMDALPLPERLPITHKALWHGWGRNLLRVRVLKASDNPLWKQEHYGFMSDPEYSQAAINLGLDDKEAIPETGDS